MKPTDGQMAPPAKLASQAFDHWSTGTLGRHKTEMVAQELARALAAAPKMITCEIR